MISIWTNIPIFVVIVTTFYPLWPPPRHTPGRLKVYFDSNNIQEISNWTFVT